MRSNRRAETGGFLELAVACVHFAVTYRAHFEVMYRPELYHADDGQLVQARLRTRELLYGPLADLRNAAAGDSSRAGIAAWSLVHGLAHS